MSQPDGRHLHALPAPAADAPAQPASLLLVVGGNTVYVFEDGDDRAPAQLLVCAGANLDVATYRVPLARWPQVLEQLREAERTTDAEPAVVIDCRRAPTRGPVMGVNYVTGRDIECVEIDQDGTALAGAIDFQAGTLVFIEFQRNPGDAGVFGWEAGWIANYRDRGWNTEWETCFRARSHDGVTPGLYVTLNLPRLAGWEAT